MQTEGRVHYMDNLRALAMLAGVGFHAAFAYSPLMNPLWPAADAGSSVLVDFGLWFLHLFRMPLFFLVAGYFAALLVAKRGMAGLFRNRLARVLLPLVLFAPPLLVGMSWLTEWAAGFVENAPPALLWIRAYIAEHGTMPFSPGWAHLWFLFYLLLFTVMVWVVATLEFGRVGRWFASRPVAAQVFGLPLLLAPALALVGTPWPAPEFFVPSLWALVFFGLYFGCGYQLFHQGELLERLRPWGTGLLIGAISAYAVLFWLTDGFVARSTGWARLVPVLLEACAGFWMTFWCLLGGKRWLDTSNAILRWLADSSYWVYLVHLPLLLAIQYPLLDLPMHWTAKFVVSVGATLLLSFASYQLLVRHTVLGRLLNGSTPATRQRQAATPGPLI